MLITKGLRLTLAAGVLALLGTMGVSAAIARPDAAPAPQPAALAQLSASLGGEKTYKARCAMCHDKPDITRAPAFSTLRKMPAQQIRIALTEGVMQQQAAGLSREEREALIAYLAPPAPAASKRSWIEPLLCEAGHRAVDLSGPETLTQMGVDPANARRLTAQQAGLTNAQLSRLDVAWTIAFPQTTTLRSQGVIVGSTLFYAAPQANQILAIDIESGCVKWSHEAAGPPRTSLAYGPLGPGGAKALIFGDSKGSINTLEAATGALIWRVDPRHDKTVPLTGAPVLFEDRIIVPISASDVGRAANPQYACCTSHGAVAAMDAATGRQLWIAHTMEDAKPLGRKNGVGIEMLGPSGAPIWSSPTIDVKRGLVYATTGENTSGPNTKTSDAVLAIDIKTGENRWTFQALPRDIWNMSCVPGRPGANCPFTVDESVMKDFDFGAGVIIAKRKNGRDILLAGQKSGHVWAINPDKAGALVWSHRFGEGTALGGIHWGLTTDGRRLFVPINDPLYAGRGEPGLNAIDIDTGKVLWRWAATADCADGRAQRLVNCETKFGLSAAPFAVDNAVLTGSLDGKLRIFDGADGKVLFTYDTARDFGERHGLAASGGAIDSQSVFAGAGTVFVGSGYGSFNQQPGNVLVAFRPRPQ